MNCVSVKKGLKKYEKVLKLCNNIFLYICVGNIVKVKEGNIVLLNSYWDFFKKFIIIGFIIFVLIMKIVGFCY